MSTSLIMGKLGSYSRQNSLATALREMGRIEKTIFILDYISSKAMRCRIQKGLNKGEAMNALARAIFFGKRGELRERALQDQLQRASVLNIIIIVRLSAKGTDGVMNAVTFAFFCYTCSGASAHYRTCGGKWRGCIAATPHYYIVSDTRKGINEWRKQQPVNLSLLNRLDFAGWPVPADFPNILWRYAMFKIFRKNCCGLDVHKTWIYACVGITDANGRTEYKQASFSSFSKDLRELADWLAKYGCKDVCMESSGKYWIPVFNILEKTCWVTLAHPKYTKP